MPIWQMILLGLLVSILTTILVGLVIWKLWGVLSNISEQRQPAKLLPLTEEAAHLLNRYAEVQELTEVERSQVRYLLMIGYRPVFDDFSRRES